MVSSVLPSNPDYALACRITDSQDTRYFAPVINQICRDHGIAFNRYHKINGWANLLFVLDDRLVIKIAAPNWASQTHREIAALRLTDKTDLPANVPTLLAQGEINGWVYLIEDMLPGSNLGNLWSSLGAADKHRIIAQTGEFAKTLNTLPVNNDEVLSVNWPEFLKQQRHDVYDRRKRQGLDGPLLADLLPFIDQQTYDIDHLPPMLMHCDLHPGNLLVTKINGKWQLSGVVDFGDAIISCDHQYELISSMILMAQGQAELNQAFIQAYGIKPNDINHFQWQLMVLSLLRHSGEMGYLLDQVPDCPQQTRWQDVAPRFFAL